MQVFGGVVVLLWVVTLLRIGTSKSRSTGPILAVSLMLATLALALANVAGAATKPRTKQLAALLIKGGADEAKCIVAKKNDYVCLYDYHGYCVEILAQWRPTAKKHWAAQPYNEAKGNCGGLPIPRGPSA